MLGPQNYGYWQGPAFPNGTDGEPYWPGGAKESVAVDCGDAFSLEGGCLFNLHADPHETTDLAAKMPDVVHALKGRFLELKSTALDQRSVLPVKASNPSRPITCGCCVKMMALSVHGARRASARYVHLSRRSHLGMVTFSWHMVQHKDPVRI